MHVPLVSQVVLMIRAAYAEAANPWTQQLLAHATTRARAREASYLDWATYQTH